MIQFLKSLMDGIEQLFKSIRTELIELGMDTSEIDEALSTIEQEKRSQEK